MNLPAYFLESTAVIFLTLGALLGGFTRIKVFTAASFVALIVFLGLPILGFAFERSFSMDWILITIIGIYAWFCAVMSLLGAGAVRYVKTRRVT